MQACFQCSHPIIAVCTILLATPTVRASDPQIVMYDSGSDVRQHSYIDLDQRDMEVYLGATPTDYAKAKNIYEHGGNSGGYAEITLAAGLQAAAAKGTTVTQGTATGTLKSAAAVNDAMIKVSYPTSDPPKCKMGGYTANADTNLPEITTGCFTTTGAITVGTTDVGTATGVANKYRTLKGFSTQAEGKMKMQETYQVYRAYYGEYDYAHQYVLGALGFMSGEGCYDPTPGVHSCTCDKTPTTCTKVWTSPCTACTAAGGYGGFTGLGDDAREQGVKKGTAYMNVWMYVIHEIEDAIMDCENSCTDPTTQTCNQDPVHAIDEAAAFYAGSLEGTTATGDADKGKLVFRLAEKRCANFGTCTGSAGQAKANQEIIQKLSEAQTKLRESKCVEVIEIKKRIVELMSIPLIQGSIRYAYKVGEDGEGLKAKAEGAVFSAAILPRVAACDADKAKIISDNMKIDCGNNCMSAGFTAVKEAFEATYECLGITCEDIGGLLVSAVEPGVYKAKAAPCVTPVMVPQNQVATSSCRAMRHLSLLVSWFFLCSGFFQF